MTAETKHLDLVQCAQRMQVGNSVYHGDFVMMVSLVGEKLDILPLAVTVKLCGPIE